MYIKIYIKSNTYAINFSVPALSGTGSSATFRFFELFYVILLFFLLFLHYTLHMWVHIAHTAFIKHIYRQVPRVPKLTMIKTGAIYLN